MKFTSFIILAFTLVLLLIGCNNETPAPGVPNSPNSGNKIEVPPVDSTEDSKASFSPSISYIGKMHVKAGQTYQLDEKYKFNDGIVFKVDTSSSRALGRASENFVTTENGSIIPCPDENNLIVFDPSDLGIESEGDIYIGRFNNTNDLNITHEEWTEKNVEFIYDEFYYIDFNDPEWIGLDKSDVFIRQSQLYSHKSFSVIGSNGVVYRNDISLDFSKDEGVGLYQFIDGNFSEYGFDDCRLYVLNPIELSEIGAKQRISSEYSVVRVAADSNEELCVVLSGVSSDVMEKMIVFDDLFRTNPLFLNGDNSYRNAIPHFMSKTNEIVFYLGALDGGMTFDIDLSRYYSELEDSELSVELSNASKYSELPSADEYVDISALSVEGISLSVPSDIDSDYFTLVLKGNGETTCQVETTIRGPGYFQNDRGWGNRYFSSSDLFISRNNEFVAYFVLKKGNKTGTFATIKPKVETIIETGHVYEYKGRVDGNIDYYCSLHENCVAYEQTKLFKKAFSGGKYTTDYTYGELGNIWIQEIIECDKFSKESTNSSQGNQTSNGCIGLTTICGNYIIKYEIAEYSYLSNSERSLKGKLIIMKDMAVVNEKDDVVFTFSLS